MEKESDPKTTGTKPRGRKTRLVIIGSVIAAVLIIVAVVWSINVAAPFHRTIITVDNQEISMDYFLKRTHLSGADTITMLELLTKEQIIKIEAPNYGIEVTEAVIDRELRAIAGGAGGNITDSEFKEWYRQRLNESRLSDAQFRDYIGTILMANQLQQYLAERVTSVAEQVHLNIIILATYDEAVAVRERWEAGENFTELARETSLNEESKEKGGDIGWFPRGVMESALEDIAFGLDIGEVSTPIFLDERYHLIMVSEKAVAREIEESILQLMKNAALESWLIEEIPFHEITYNFDSETSAWINWQLEKMAED